MRRAWILIGASLLTLLAQGAEVASWRPGRADGIEVDGGTGVIVPVKDYFKRASFEIRITKKPQGAAWLVAEYDDRGYALIEAEPSPAQSAMWGIARLNTGKSRRALFGYSQGAPEKLRLYGIERLTRLSLVDSEPTREPLPEVRPAVDFRRASQRVTTAGADAATPEQLPETLATMRNLLPLARALGFNGIESYVKWNFVERQPGVFDWSFYDAVVDELDRHGLQWFPLLIVGSAYALPDWFYDSPDNDGFVCLEHGMRSDIPTIFAGRQDRYVRRFLQEFGKHYAARKTLLGVRLGPSGNYGEAQYPARGDWRYKGRVLHTHIGYWAGDKFAESNFRESMKQRYGTIEALNAAWEAKLPGFEEVKPFLPVTAWARRKRIDFAQWYMDAMSRWCEKWADWTREALPSAVIHQSSGGWGPVEIGTDYTYQARTMARLKGGIRLTNESDNYAQNFTITRMASSAARFYGAQLGYEPGGFGSARGVAARLYNAVTNGADHLFYYHSNLYANDQAIGTWLRHAKMLDARSAPAVDVAAFYPDTGIRLDDEAIRYMWGSAFLTRAEAMRSAAEFDYASEQMIEDGALSRYKVLVFLWGHITEKPVLEKIAKWVEEGGTLIYLERPRGLLETVEGDASVSKRWVEGKTGKGRVVFFKGDPEPGEPYARFVRDELRKLDGLRPAVKAALRMQKADSVYWSVLESGAMALLNFADDPANVRLADGRVVKLEPYSLWMQ